ncbi:MAG: DUF4097 family beta strand repeat-containing protein [Victivallaceae bacterium]
MTKREFLDKLQARLAGLPPEEFNATLEFFSESIDDRVEEGFSEAEAVAGLGDLDALVADQMRGGGRAAKRRKSKPPILIGTGCLAAVIGAPVLLAVLAILALVFFSTAFTVVTAFLLLLPVILVAVPVGGVWYGLRSCKLRWRGFHPIWREIDFAGPFERIEFRDHNLRLRIKPSPDQRIHFEYAEWEDKHYRFDEAGGILRIEALERRSFNQDHLPEATLKLPADCRSALDIRADNGKITATGLNQLADAAFELDNGKITLEDLTVNGPVASHAANGKLDFVRVRCAELTAGVANGQVTLADVATSGPAAVKLGNGKLKLEDFAPAAAATLTVEIGQLTGTLRKPDLIPLPPEITHSGIWGTPPNELKIKLRLGQLKVRTTEK